MKKWQTRVTPIAPTAINLWMDKAQLSSCCKQQADPSSDCEANKVLNSPQNASGSPADVSQIEVQRYLRDLINLNRLVESIVLKETERLEFLKIATAETNSWQIYVEKCIESAARRR